VEGAAHRPDSGIESSRSRPPRWRALSGRAWRAVDAFVPTRGAAIVLLAVAFGVYWIEAAAWPLDRGRDTWDYLSYYLQIWEGDPVFRPLMAMRTPITPLALGIPLQLWGPGLLEVVMGLLYATSILAWGMTALTFGRVAALVTAVVLVAYPPYGSLFHVAASDGVFATVFALWCLAMVRAARAPAAWKFAVLAAGATAAFLTRPPAGLLLAFGLFPIVLPGSLRQRLARAGVFAVVAVALLGGWMGYNALRYDDFTLTRQRTAWVPFGGAFGDRAIKPGNGRASRRLAQAVERYILSEPPYRRAGEDVVTYFENPSTYEFIHLLALSDRVWGWKSDYRVLRQAAEESQSPGAEGGGLGLEGVWRRTRLMLEFRFWRAASAPRKPEPPPVANVVVDGRLVPNPAALGPSRLLVPYGWMWCASPELSRCVSRDLSRAIRDPGQRRQYVSLVRRLSEWDAQLPSRKGRVWLAAQLNRYTWHIPRGWFWIALAVIALAIRRPVGTRIAVALIASGLVVILAHAVSGVVDSAYTLSVYPAFIVVAIVGLTGLKATPRARDA